MLDPLPCWQHLPREEIRSRVAAIVETVETNAAQARENQGKTVLGAAAVLAQSPTPVQLKRSPAPLTEEIR